MPDEEIFDLVDENGRITGQAPRNQCHGDPALLHAVVHVMVTNAAGDLFLQKRSRHKDIQPGKWDTAVGGHLQPGESPETAAHREMLEELGVSPASLTFAYRYIWRSAVESELVHTFTTTHEGPFELQASEIEEGRFWTLHEITSHDYSSFTPNFLHELTRFQQWRKERYP
jgi:isopentenyldiphosphate isomerase